MHDPTEPTPTPNPDSVADTAAPISPARRRWLWAAGGMAGAVGLGALGWQALRQAQGNTNTQAVEDFWALRLATPELAAATDAPDPASLYPLAAYRGKPLLVNFWATWCPPCVRELPLLHALALSQPGVQVLGIAVDRPAPVRQWLQRQPLAYPVLMAGVGGLGLTRSLGNVQGGLPFSLLLDARGRVVQRKIGEFSPELLQRWMAAIADQSLPDRR